MAALLLKEEMITIHINPDQDKRTQCGHESSHYSEKGVFKNVCHFYGVLSNKKKMMLTMKMYELELLFLLSPVLKSALNAHKTFLITVAYIDQPAAVVEHFCFPSRNTE